MSKKGLFTQVKLDAKSKPVFTAKIRNIEEKILHEALMNIVVEANNEAIKELIVKI